MLSSWNWKEIVQNLLIALVIIVPFRLYVAQPFIVDGESMYPTFKNGQYLIVDEFTYHFKSPERGSVLILNYPRDPSRSFIKRVIGLPGETVLIENGQVTIQKAGEADLVLNEPYIELTKEDNTSYTLGEGEYFVMGDNRAQSADSRLWGSVPQKNIVGRPIWRAWPLDLWPGDYTYAQ